MLHSGEFEEFGKPHPAVYLTTLEKLGVNAEDAIAFEDSLNGIKAAKAANISCIAIPKEEDLRDEKFQIADYILSSLADFDESMWEKVNR